MQVKGSANIMFTVVSTQEIKADDFLLRFKDEVPHINGSRSISARPVMFLFLFFVGFICVCVCVCVCVICAVFLLMFDILCKVTAHACW